MRTLLICYFIIVLPAAAVAQLPDSVRRHIDSSLYILKTHSLYAKRLDWPALQQQVYREAAGAKEPKATFEALKPVFDALGDRHAAYYQFDDQYRLQDTALEHRYNDSIRAAWLRGPAVRQQMIGKMAYLNVPFMKAGSPAAIDQYAGFIRQALAALQLQSPKGWIIDLRLNGGGNIRPMLAGLAAFFPDGVIGYYIDRDGRPTDTLAFVNGGFSINSLPQAALPASPFSLQQARVAVLIGPGTASSGEGLAVILGQRNDVKIFGTPSAGRANATNGFVFNGENSYFLISTASLGDRRGKALPEQVQPDIRLTGNDAFADPQRDALVKAAAQWLADMR